MATRPEEPGSSELRARTAELERERQLLNAIANHAPSLLCLVDADGRVRPLATNIAFERTLGYEPSESGGDIFWERFRVRRRRLVPSGATVNSSDWIPTSCANAIRPRPQHNGAHATEHPPIIAKGIYACGMRASSAAPSASRTGSSSIRSSTSWKKPRTIIRSASPRERPRAIR
jgi:PAS domain-containing protein